MEVTNRNLQEGVRLITISGEMDLYNAHEFRAVVDRAFSDGMHGVIVDLQELEYIDSSGISAMLYTFTQCRNRSVGLCFLNIMGSVKRVIELTSLGGFFPVADNLDHALARLAANRE